MKKLVRQTFCVSQVAFFSLKFVLLPYDSITSSRIVAELSIILVKYFSILTITCRRLSKIIFFTYMTVFTHTYRRHLSLFHHWSELHFLWLKLYRHLHDICFAMFSIHFFLLSSWKPRFKSSIRIQILNLYSLGCKLISVVWVIHLWLLKKRLLYE